MIKFFIIIIFSVIIENQFEIKKDFEVLFILIGWLFSRPANGRHFLWRDP